MKNLLLCLIAGFALSACAISRDTPAPVVNVTGPKPNPVAARPVTPPAVATAPVTAASNTASTGTTLNKIDQDDDGAVIQQSPANNTVNVNNAAKSSQVVAVPGAAVANIGGIQWLRPTDGQILQPYSVATKGVDIAGNEGQPILASADGKVVYSGNGLKGYGNLIIIKHQNSYLTAYSHNKVNLVKEGAMVKRGQKIAELGKTDSDKPILHFELRQSGKPVNPTSIFSK